MSGEAYLKLARVLDTLPNGFPATASGIEIRLLRKIFRPEEADLFCQLKLTWETSEQISRRTGLLEGLEDRLTAMWQRGQIFGVQIGSLKLFRMAPWAFGIYEFQLPHMDRELAEMCEAYMEVYGREFLKTPPPFMQVVPVEKEIPGRHEALTYEKVSSIIERGKSFAVMDCICKKERALLDRGCSKPREVCLAIAPLPGVLDALPAARSISREEADQVLAKSEEAALVHLTWNVQSGHFFICNCCGCCCGVLRGINELRIPAAEVVNSYYYAVIDGSSCQACGTCADERCQVGAIEKGGDSYRVLRERCIGCGLCIRTCPAGAIQLARKPLEEQVPPPRDEMAWYEERARRRGVDFSAFK